MSALAPSIDGGGNLSFPDATCPGLNPNPQLGSLQNNGSPTQTIALQAGSAAIDAAVNCPPPGEGQRGFNRPEDGNGDGTAACDIGSFEAEFTPDPQVDLVVTKDGTGSDPAFVGHNLSRTCLALGV